MSFLVVQPTDVPQAFSEIQEQLKQIVLRIKETPDQETRLELLKEMLTLLREADRILNTTEIAEK